jgi:hypothetical protein
MTWLKQKLGITNPVISMSMGRTAHLREEKSYESDIPLCMAHKISPRSYCTGASLVEMT